MRAFKDFCQPRSSFFQKQEQNQTIKPISQYVFNSKNQEMRSFQDHNFNRWNQIYVNNQHLNRISPLNGKKISFKDMPLEDNQMKYYPNTSQQIKNQIYKIPPRNIMSQNENYKKSFNTINSNNFVQNRQYQTPFKHSEPEHQGVLLSYSNNYQNNKADYNKNRNIYRQGLNQTIIEERNNLAQENRKLRTIIQNQYKPLKQLYLKLIKQQQDRDYLITKLQWKVKQLVKEMKNAQQSSPYTQNIQTQFKGNKQNPDLNHNFYANNKRFIQNQRETRQPTANEINKTMTYGPYPLMNTNFRYNNLNQISIIKSKIS